jgi:hypothetical protein
MRQQQTRHYYSDESLRKFDPFLRSCSISSNDFLANSDARKLSTRRAGQMLDETAAKKPRLCSAGDTSGGDAAAASAAAPVDRLSALPDEMLHHDHVMSFLRAWEVARTCVLSRRWRHLWASAPCVDLRVWRIGRHLCPPKWVCQVRVPLLDRAGRVRAFGHAPAALEPRLCIAVLAAPGGVLLS